MQYSNTYTDDDNYAHIDYWETDDENGRTIAVVCRDTAKVFYIDNSFRMDSMCKEFINEVLQELEDNTLRDKLNKLDSWAYDRAYSIDEVEYLNSFLR